MMMMVLGVAMMTMTTTTTTMMMIMMLLQPCYSIQVHGAGIMSDRLVQDVTLDSIPSFRGFANQVFMDIMYYLTPS